MVLTLDPILALLATLILRSENNRGLSVETSVVIREFLIPLNLLSESKFSSLKSSSQIR